MRSKKTMPKTKAARAFSRCIPIRYKEYWVYLNEVLNESYYKRNIVNKKAREHKRELKDALSNLS